MVKPADKYLVSISYSFYENYQLSTLAFFDDGFSISGPFIDTTRYQYRQVIKVVRAKILPLLKLYMYGSYFVINSYFPGLIIEIFVKHQVLCERYNKSVHNPGCSSFQYWLNNK